MTPTLPTYPSIESKVSKLRDNKNINFNFNYTEARITIDRFNKIIFFIKDSSIIVKVKKSNKTIIEFEDFMLDPNNLASFKRCFKGKSYKYIDGMLVLSEIARQVKFIEPTRLFFLF